MVEVALVVTLGSVAIIMGLIVVTRWLLGSIFIDEEGAEIEQQDQEPTEKPPTSPPA